jgi:tetratricopeptide (TPR) repeat protein
MRFTLRAVIFEWLRQPEKALEAYVAGFRASPKDVRAARSIAWIHAQKQHWGAAAEWFGKALELEPEHADTWFNLGYAREQAGDRRAALDAFLRATALNPRLDRAWYGMGMIHAHLGDHAAAAGELRQAAELQPMNGAAWYALGMAHHHCNEPDKVRGVVEHCVAHDPQTARRLIQDAERADLVPLLPD